MDIFISKKMRNFILLAQTNNIARAAESLFFRRNEDRP